ncbi:Rpn family recombination-promoting nuclease/putative transposase [Skermanella aerolata]|uniref:Rpn family recombination-promoting nuclease/putative transposase n=1 Tax=Skermanella aerolata TaxID=393310 RepID=UPI0005CA478B|nr:Rpn family recombination-promoting nuclease/putative transposase [Skermanella aerolata]KJB92796.1 hypothetical protein N826_21175 [Skermanella aerolata KACC 11604]
MTRPSGTTAGDTDAIKGDRRLIRRHDQFAKLLLDLPGNADAFLRERLPAAVVACLMADPATDRSESFVDPALAEHRGDRVFSLATLDGEPLLIWTMVEHKSSPEGDTLVQILGCLSGAATRGARRRRNPDGTVWIVPAAVFAIVLYHGADRWSLPTTLGNAYGMHAEMRAAGPLDFGYSLVDLSALPDAELSRHPELQAGLLMLKYATRDDDPDVTLDRLLGAAALIDLTVIRIVVRYLFKSGDAHYRERLRAALGRVLPGQEDRIMPTIGEWYEAEGYAKGKHETLAKTLLLIIENRFGAASETVEEKVRSATVEDLDRWTRAIFKAPSLEAMFSDPMH